MTKKELKQLGLPLGLSLYGESTVLKYVADSPIIFLFDEDHDSIINKNKNFENACKLIQEADVNVVGVESMSGGRNWNEQYEEYDDSRYPVNKIISTSNEFAELLKSSHPNIVFGVESEGIFTKLGEIIAKGKLDVNNMDDHRLNKLRSKHLVKTLCELRNQQEKNGNMILNCGINHNNHIADWIEGKNIDEIAGINASYVRVNTF